MFAQALDGIFFMMLDVPIAWNDAADKEALLDDAFAHQCITQVNDAMLAQYGATRDEFIGLTPHDFFAHDIAHGREMWRRLFDQGRLHIETRERRWDGAQIWIEGDYICLYDDAGRITGHFGIQRDITLRKQALEELRHSEETIRALMELAAQGIVLVDEAGRIVMVNAMVEQMFGCCREDLVGQQLHTLVPAAARDRHDDLCAAYFQSPRARPMGIGLDLSARRCDGSTFPVEVSLSYVETGANRIVMALITDTTERRGAEEALHRYADELAARNEELDAFAHTVAHDLKGPLSLAMGYSELLLFSDETLSAESQHLALEHVNRSMHKMTNIIDELLLLATVRKEDVRLDTLDMKSIVAGAMGRVTHLLEQRHARIVLPKGWAAALGHAAWVEEAWVNYLSNAIKYGGDPPHIELGSDVGAGTVRFWVRDNGPGLSPDEQALLFVPFTRLDRVRAKGHGLGLSIVRRIVERLGGQVGVDSQKGAGSTFWFTLPAV
ncbi:MAG: PAS domain-containing sensor histidine kinase [Anaerolineae bacterium]|nr:PAS domain-containing sensor histidine kinase [Anaerolineae bacterium]